MMDSNQSGYKQETPDVSSTSPDKKVREDLAALEEQIGLCQSMLAETGDSASVDANEALLAVIGFLEACVPRMVDLIEAAAQGALGEEAFELCLQMNDRLTNVLADVDKPPNERQPLTPAASASGGGNDDGSSLVAEMDDVDISSSTAGRKGGGKTSGMTEEDGALKTMPAIAADPFAGGPDLLAPTPPSNPFAGDEQAAQLPAQAGGADDDDFDAFFRDRTAAPGTD